MAELWAKTIRPPKIISTKIIGVSHHHLLCQKKENNSPTIPSRLLRLSFRCISVPFYCESRMADMPEPDSIANSESRIENGRNQTQLRSANREERLARSSKKRIKTPFNCE